MSVYMAAARVVQQARQTRQTWVANQISPQHLQLCWAPPGCFFARGPKVKWHWRQLWWTDRLAQSTSFHAYICIFYSSVICKLSSKLQPTSVTTVVSNNMEFWRGVHIFGCWLLQEYNTYHMYCSVRSYLQTRWSALSIWISLLLNKRFFQVNATEPEGLKNNEHECQSLFMLTYDCQRVLHFTQVTKLFSINTYL